MLLLVDRDAERIHSPALGKKLNVPQWRPSHARLTLKKTLSPRDLPVEALAGSDPDHNNPLSCPVRVGVTWGENLNLNSSI